MLQALMRTVAAIVPGIPGQWSNSAVCALLGGGRPPVEAEHPKLMPRMQIYGTQYLERDGIMTLWTVQEPGGLDGRRAALGLEPVAENRARLLAVRRRASNDRDERAAEDG